MNSVSLLIAVILLALRSVTASPIQSPCEDVYLNCTNPLHDTLIEEGFNILKEETLSTHCNDIVEDIICKKNYLSTCDPEGYKAFSLATDGILEVLLELCNQSSGLRKVYGLHSPCIENTSDAYQECILNATERVNENDSSANEDDFYEDDIESSNAMMRRMCWFYDPFKSCVTRETRKSCGNSAAQLIEEMIIRMASNVVKAKCLK